MDDAGFLFREADGWFHPTPELTRGPWRPDAMHGGPPSALVGAMIHDATPDGEQVARVVIDLEAPVPIEPLRADVTRRQVSRRVAHLDVVLSTERAAVCSAHAVLLRADPLPPPDWTPGGEWVIPGSDLAVDMGPGFHDVPGVFHRDAIEHRVVAGSIRGVGPCVSWATLECDVLAGRPTPGLAALLAVADFGSAIAQPYPMDGAVGLINVDVSLALSRAPRGRWFRLDSTDMVGDGGVGLAVTHLADEAGPIGVLHQSQLGSAR